MTTQNGAVLSPEAQALARLTDYDASEELGFNGFEEGSLSAPDYQPALATEPTALDEEEEDSPSLPSMPHSPSVPSESPPPPLASASDSEEEEDIDPRSVRTKVNLVNSPWSKGLLIAGGAGGVFLFLFLFLQGVTSRPNTPPPVPTASASPTVGTDDGAALDETSKYKTEAALTTQKTALNQVAPKPTPTATTTPAPTPTASLRPALAPPISNLTPMPVMPLSPVSQTPVTPPDPLQQWQTAARMGSYGRLAPGSSSYASTSVPVVPTPAPSFVPTVPTMPQSSNGTLPLTSLRASSSTPGLRDHPLSSVLVGSTVAAQLSTAIVMAGDNSTPVSPDSPSATRYLVKLTADLKDADGNVALPSGSQIVVVARTFSQQNGNAEFVATSVLVNNKEYSAPKDALVIRSTNGGLLSFNKQSTGGGLFQAVLPAFFSGLSQTGQVLNQPSSSATVSGGSISATTTSSSPKPLAGFAQGFGQNLSQQMQQQAQAANQKAASAPVSWQLGTGSPVLVFVSASFQL